MRYKMYEHLILGIFIMVTIIFTHYICSVISDMLPKSRNTVNWTKIANNIKRSV